MGFFHPTPPRHLDPRRERCSIRSLSRLTGAPEREVTKQYFYGWRDSRGRWSSTHHDTLSPPGQPLPSSPSPPPSWTRGCRVAANEARDEAGGGRRIESRCSFGRELSVACVMQRRATEAECVDLLMMMARVSADVCHWVISCPGGTSGAGRHLPHMSARPSPCPPVRWWQHLRLGSGGPPARQMGVNWMHPSRASLTLTAGTGSGLHIQVFLFLCYSPCFLPSERSRASREPAPSSRPVHRILAAANDTPSYQSERSVEGGRDGGGE